MPRVFLSHSSKDKDLVRRIAVDLRSSGIDVWLDEWEINVGQSISQKIEEGIERCQFVCVLLSKESVKSGWVSKEWRSVVGDEAEKNQCIVLPLLAEECEIPRMLKDKKYADFTKEYDFAMRSVVSAIRNLTVDLIERREIGPRITFEPGDAYDLISPALKWIEENLKGYKWKIPLQKMKGTKKCIADLVRDYGNEEEQIRFPWGLTLYFQADIVGAIRIPNSKMFGWIIAMVNPCTMFEYDVIRSHYIMAASAAYKGYVFWDRTNSMSRDGLAALQTYGTPYLGIGDEVKDIQKHIKYVMYNRENNEFYDDLEASIVICNRSNFSWI